MGEGENDVEVGGGEEFGFALFKPPLTGDVLALGAVSIAAGMVEDALGAAVGAALDVASQGGGAGSEGGGRRSGTDLGLEDRCCDTLRYGGGGYRLPPGAVLAFYSEGSLEGTSFFARCGSNRSRGLGILDRVARLTCR
jgi:hypothetical protein